MTIENLGLLLDKFGIQSWEDFRTRDFGEKSKFISLVQSTVEYKSQSDLQNVLDVIKYEPGLKMCFRVTKNAGGEWENLPNETFAKKLAFFTSRTVITFPFHELSYSQRRVLISKRARAFVKYIPCLRSGFGVPHLFLPRAVLFRDVFGQQLLDHAGEIVRHAFGLRYQVFI